MSAIQQKPTDISKFIAELSELQASLNSVKQLIDKFFIPVRILEEARIYLKAGRNIESIGAAKFSDFQQQSTDKVFKVIEKFIAACIEKNYRKSLLEDLQKYPGIVSKDGEVQFSLEGEKFLCKKEQDFIKRLTKFFIQKFSENQLCLHEVEICYMQFLKKEKITMFSPEHFEINPRMLKITQNSLSGVLSSCPKSVRNTTVKRWEHKAAIEEKKNNALAKIRRARKLSDVRKTTALINKTYQTQHSDIHLLCQVSQALGKELSQITEQEVITYKKTQADRIFQELCSSESNKPVQKKPPKRKKKRKPSKENELASSPSSSPVITSLPKPVLKPQVTKTEVLPLLTRVSNWFTIGDDLERIKVLFADPRYQHATEAGLKRQRDDHNLNGMQQVFYNLTDRNRYGKYIGKVNGHDSWIFHAIKTILRKGEQEMQIGLISIGIGERHTTSGSSKAILHMKFDELSQSITCGKDLTPQLEIDTDSAWTTVVGKENAYKIINDTIVFEYDTGVRFEIKPFL